MRKLNVLQVTKQEVFQNWGYPLPQNWEDPVYIRCDSKEVLQVPISSIGHNVNRYTFGLG